MYADDLHCTSEKNAEWQLLKVKTASTVHRAVGLEVAQKSALSAVKPLADDATRVN